MVRVRDRVRVRNRVRLSVKQLGGELLHQRPTCVPCYYTNIETYTKQAQFHFFHCRNHCSTIKNDVNEATPTNTINLKDETFTDCKPWQHTTNTGSERLNNSICSLFNQRLANNQLKAFFNLYSRQCQTINSKTVNNATKQHPEHVTAKATVVNSHKFRFHFLTEWLWNKTNLLTACMCILVSWVTMT